jgi:integrase
VIDAAEDARSYQGLVAGAPQGVDVDLSLVRIPEDWLIFPSRAGQPSAPRHPDSVTKQFANRGKKILGFSIRLHDLRVTHGTWLLDQGNANPHSCQKARS